MESDALEKLYYRFVNECRSDQNRGVSGDERSLKLLEKQLIVIAQNLAGDELLEEFKGSKYEESILKAVLSHHRRLLLRKSDSKETVKSPIFSTVERMENLVAHNEVYINFAIEYANMIRENKKAGYRVAMEFPVITLEDVETIIGIKKK